MTMPQGLLAEMDHVLDEERKAQARAERRSKRGR